MHAVLAFAWTGRLHLLEIMLRVSEQDLILDVIAQRRLGADQILEHIVPENAVDRPHAVGPFGMAGAGQMIDETRDA